MALNVQRALDAGYSQEEINIYLSKQAKPPIPEQSDVTRTDVLNVPGQTADATSTLDIGGSTVKKFAGILPSLPKDKPGPIPVPKEQMKVYGLLKSLPPELSEEVKAKAIDLMRQRKSGTIKRKRFSAIDAVKNIPENVEDIVKETGSLILNIGKQGYETAKATGKDWKSMFQGKPPEEVAAKFEPIFDFAGKVGKDWKAILTGQEVSEVAETAPGQAIGEGIDQLIKHPGIAIGNFVERRPVDAVLIGYALERAAGEGIRLGAKSVSKIAGKGSKIADKVSKFTSIERKSQILELKAKTADGVEQTLKTVEFPRKYSTDPLTKYMVQKPFDELLNKYPKLQESFAKRKANKFMDGMRNYYDEAGFRERAAIQKEVMDELNKLSKDELSVAVPYLEGRAQLVGGPSEQLKKFEEYYRGLNKTIQDDFAKMGKLSPEIIEGRMYQPLEKATGLTREQIKAELGDFSPAYVHHFFPDKYPLKMGVFFTDTTGKRFKPGSLKQSKGVSGYSENLKEVLPKWTAEYVKFKNTEKYISEITENFGVPVNLKDVKAVSNGYEVKGQIYAGYKILAPDGYMKFYRGKIDFYKEVSKRLKDTTFDEAMGDMLKQTLLGEGKEFMGASKSVRAYLIPDHIAQRLESQAAPLFGSQKVQNVTRMVYDKPVQIWKDSVLAASPRWIKNNVAGDIIFNSMEGVGPLSYGRAFTAQYKNLIPDDLLSVSFANVMKYNPKLGLAARSTIGQYAKKLGETKVVQLGAKGKDFGYALNTMFEQPFVRSLYVKLARDKAKQMIKATGGKATEENIFKIMLQIKNSRVLHEPLVGKVKETLPVFNLLGNTERKYLRRAIPFYNWFKFMVQYSAKLPAKHPFKTVGGRGLAALSEDQREEAFKQYFPFMVKEIEGGGIPDRFSNLWPVDTAKDGKTIFFNARGMNVFTTIEDILQGDIVNMMSPIIKVSVERSLGQSVFTKTKFRTGEEGVDFKEFKKTTPPLFEHIAQQFPQYQLLKQSLVPARQYASGTIFNPDPILDPITGEYKYKIDDVEKILNFMGIDNRTMDVREMWERFQNKKRQAISTTFKKYQSQADTALTMQEIKGLFNDIKRDTKLWGTIKGEIKEQKGYEGTKKKELINVIKSKPKYTILEVTEGQ